MARSVPALVVLRSAYMFLLRKRLLDPLIGFLDSSRLHRRHFFFFFTFSCVFSRVGPDFFGECSMILTFRLVFLVFFFLFRFFSGGYANQSRSSHASSLPFALHDFNINPSPPPLPWSLLSERNSNRHQIITDTHLENEIFKRPKYQIISSH